jgi:hypothetical protein
MLGRGVRLEDIEMVFENIGFIIFNYDRCIEHFLLNALRQLYSISEQRAAETLQRLNIIHPYGDVGILKTALSNDGVFYGGDYEGLNEDYVDLAKRIRTYTEAKDDEERENMDIALRDAERWVFLGFGFHEQNLKLLKPGAGHEQKTVFATALKMSGSDLNVTRGRIAAFFKSGARVDMHQQLEKTVHPNLTCAQLFDYYTQSLAN